MSHLRSTLPAVTWKCCRCGAKTFIIAFNGLEYCREHFLAETPETPRELLPKHRGGTVELK